MDIDDVALPELSDERIEEIENALFDEIGRDRAAARSLAERERVRRGRRGRVWLGASGAAAVIAVAAVLAPSMPTIIAGSGAGSDESAPAYTGEGAGTFDEDGGADFGPTAEGEQSGPEATATGEREIIARASAIVEVDDVEAAADTISATAERLGGYVEAMSLGMDGIASDMPLPADGAEGVTPAASGAWVTIRVPAGSLDEATAALRDMGQVTSSQIDRRDVTGEAVDLRARVSALEASVKRLTALVAEAASTADLIAVEEALAARQSDLESYQQQLKQLEEQVGMSSLTVTLTRPAPIVTADPAGFADGLAAGWSGLVASVNGIVIALGFLLPWLGVAAIVGGIVWAARRTVMRRRSMSAADARDD